MITLRSFRRRLKWHLESVNKYLSNKNENTKNIKCEYRRNRLSSHDSCVRERKLGGVTEIVMNNGRRSSVRFREVQQFRQKWIWFLFTPVSLLIIIPFIYGMYTQLIMGQQWGTKPLPDTVLLIVGPLFISLGVGILYLFYILRLEVEVRDDALYIRFYPLTSKTINFPEIASCEARTYRPIKEYGGWGIRYGWKRGKAYNVSGNRGVQLKFLNGKKLLIGSQRPEELAQAIKERMRQ